MTVRWPQWLLLTGLTFLLLGCVSHGTRMDILSQHYSFSVDYGRSVEDSLHAGSYNWVYYQVNATNFPSAESGQAPLSAVLVDVASADAVNRIISAQANAGRRPATLKELLAFGEAYPEIQAKLPVIALGSSSDILVTSFLRQFQFDVMSANTEIDRRVVKLYPYLGGELFGRTVNLSPMGTTDFETYTTFLACFIEQH
jgi:hypothetical protein